MSRDRLNFLFLNVGHFLDHLFMLVFATVAALRLTEEWGMSYAALIPYATPGFVAFGIGAIPAGWIADKWSREGMMVIFFIGIGASSIATALAGSPVEIALGLLAIGLFAAIYHPVGLAMVVHGRQKTGLPLAINGVFGNLGVAVAALLTGWLIDTAGWRSAFVLPGAVSIGLGFAYAAFVWSGRRSGAADRAGGSGGGAAERQAAAEEQPAATKQVATARQAAVARQTAAEEQAAAEKQPAATKQAATARQGAAEKQVAAEERTADAKQTTAAKQAATARQATTAKKPAAAGQAPVAPQPAAPERPAAGPSSIGRAAFVRVLSIIVFTTAIGGLVFQSTTFALPKIFDERLAGLAGSATAVGGYAFVVFAVAALAQLVVGYLVDRHSVRTVFAFVAGLQAVCFALMHQLTGLAALVVATAFMLVVFGQIPINDVLVGRITRSEWRSRVYSIRYIVTFSVMASALPLIAWLHASRGFGALFAVMAAAAGGIFAAVLLLPRTGAIAGRPSAA